MKPNRFLAIFITFLFLASIFIVLIPNVLAAAPTVTTNDATGVEETNATLRGTIVNDGGENISDIFEYYNTGEDSNTFAHNNYWTGQTFTTNCVYNITSIKLKLYRIDSPGTVTVGICATDINGKPTGSDLTNGTTNGNTLPTGTSEWRQILLTSHRLNESIKYAIVVRIDGSGQLNWKLDIGGSYSGGSETRSSNSGLSWTLYIGEDCMFETYGYFHGCYAKFQYGTTVSYGTNTTIQRVITGQSFSENILGLNPGTLYHFRVSTNNSNWTSHGSDKTFLTKPNVSLYLTTIPINMTSIGLSWTKGAGANRTVIRYSYISYPISITDGTLLYNNTGTSVNNTGLTAGHTYFYSIWSFASWGSLYQYSEVVNVYDTTLYNINSSFIINFPEYLEGGEYIIASGTVVNITGIPLNNVWVYVNITDYFNNVVSGSSTRVYIINGYFYYYFSSSAMIPGVYFIHAYFIQSGKNYNITRILYLSQPGGLGHARAMIYFNFYNTNEGLGLPLETLKIYINNTRIFQNTFESYTGSIVNVKIKDYYDSILYQNDFTINSTTTFLDLGLTFHSWKICNKNDDYYMVSFLKQNASRWYERGVCPYESVEFLLPSGAYLMRIYDRNLVDILSQSYVVNRSMVYIIWGTNLSTIIAGQSVISNQLLSLGGVTVVSGGGGLSAEDSNKLKSLYKEVLKAENQSNITAQAKSWMKSSIFLGIENFYLIMVVLGCIALASVDVARSKKRNAKNFKTEAWACFIIAFVMFLLFIWYTQL